MSSNTFIMIMFKYFLSNFTYFCVIVIFLTKVLVSVVWIALSLLINSSYITSLTACFSTTSVNVFESIRTGFNLSTSNLSKLSTVVSKLAKSTFFAKSVVSTSTAFLKSDFNAELKNSNSTFNLFTTVVWFWKITHIM